MGPLIPPRFLTAGKENIAPQPQSPHGAVPLVLTPPGKVRDKLPAGRAPSLAPPPTVSSALSGLQLRP